MLYFCENGVVVFQFSRFGVTINSNLSIIYSWWALIAWSIRPNLDDVTLSSVSLVSKMEAIFQSLDYLFYNFLSADWNL